MTGLPYASLVDADGQPFTLDTPDIKRAVSESIPHLGDRLTANLRRFLLPSDYPIISFTYLIVRRHMVDCDVAVAFARYLEWVEESRFAREEARDYLMVNMDKDILQLVEDKVLRVMTCGEDDEHSVWDLMEEQKHEVSYYFILIFSVSHFEYSQKGMAEATDVEVACHDRCTYCSCMCFGTYCLCHSSAGNPLSPSHCRIMNTVQHFDETDSRSSFAERSCLMTGK